MKRRWFVSDSRSGPETIRELHGSDREFTAAAACDPWQKDACGHGSS